MLDGNLKIEACFVNSDYHTRDFNFYLLGAGFGKKSSDNRHTIGSLNTVIAQTNHTALSGTYFQGSLSYSHRPTTNDRFNALLKYSYLLDERSPQRASLGGKVNGFWQMSRILSPDVNYDMNDNLIVSGK